MRLITTNAQLSDHCSVTFTELDIVRIWPFIDLATDTYLEDILTPELLETLLVYADDGTDNGSGIDLAELGKLLEVARRPLASLALYEAFSTLEIRIGNDGIFQTGAGSGSDAQPIYSIQRINAKNDLLRLGTNGLERLLLYLEKNKADFTDWATSEERTFQLQRIIPTAKEFTLHFSPLANKRLTYTALLSRMAAIENDVVKPILGNALYDALLAEILVGTISTENKALLSFLRPLVAKLTIANAMPELMMQIEAYGVFSTFLESADKSITSTKAPQTARYAEMRDRLIAEAGVKQVDIIAYLEANKADYPLFENSAADVAEADSARNAAWDDERKSHPIQYF